MFLGLGFWPAPARSSRRLGWETIYYSDAGGSRWPKEKPVSKVLLATAVVVAFVSPAQAAAKKAKTPEQACQAQALASIAREWPNVLHGTFEIILKGNRCLVLLQAPAVFEDKRAARLLDGKTGVLLSEFYGPKDSNRGLCTYRDGKFPSGECTWTEYLEKANQM